MGRLRRSCSAAGAIAVSLALMGLAPTGAQASAFSFKNAKFVGECDKDTGLVLAANGETAAGGRCIFTGHGKSWALQAELPLPAARLSAIRDMEAFSADGNTFALVERGIGAPHVRVFVRAFETWTEQATLSGEYTRVALSGDGNTMLIGGSSTEHPNGAAWVFVRGGETWAQQGPTLFLQSIREAKRCVFGNAVSLSTDGNTALVGCSGKGKKGAAYVYVRAGEAWQLQSTIHAGAGAKYFADAVALSGDGSTALVADPGYAKKHQEACRCTHDPAKRGRSRARS